MRAPSATRGGAVPRAVVRHVRMHGGHAGGDRRKGGGNLVVVSPSHPGSDRFFGSRPHPTHLRSQHFARCQSATPRPLSACGFVPLATVARWLPRSGITALNGPLEALHRREMVIDILDLTGGSVLEPRGRPWGKRRQCPAVRPHGTPAERTTSRVLLVSQSPSLTS